jgi:hypothetical protein
MSHSPSYYFLRVKEPTSVNNLQLDYNNYNSRVNPSAPAFTWLLGIPQTCGEPDPLEPPFINYQYLRFDQSSYFKPRVDVYLTFIGKDRNLLSSSVCSALNSRSLPIPPTCSNTPEPEAEPTYQINFKTFMDNLIDNNLISN